MTDSLGARLPVYHTVRSLWFSNIPQVTHYILRFLEVASLLCHKQMNKLALQDQSSLHFFLFLFFYFRFVCLDQNVHVSSFSWIPYVIMSPEICLLSDRNVAKSFPDTPEASCRCQQLLNKRKTGVWKRGIKKKR